MAQFSLKQLAHTLRAEIIGDPDLLIKGVADLETASQGQISFLANRRYLDAMQKTKASCVIVDGQSPRPEGRAYLVAANPSTAFQEVLTLFFGKREATGFTGIQGFIHPEASIGTDVQIGPGSVVDKGVRIGARTRIGPNVVLGAHVTIGEDCIIHAGVVIREYCTLGNRVIIQPNTVIGSCGFGYATDEKGTHTKLEQYGSVVIEDDVEIGALTAIDRGRFTETRICTGSKIDNLVQIAHAVQVGPHNLIISQTGIAGSTKTGRNVVMAGQSAAIGHLTIADGVIIAARGAASKSITEPGSRWAGAPAEPLADHNRRSVHLRNIEKTVKRLTELEKRVTELES